MRFCLLDRGLAALESFTNELDARRIGWAAEDMMENRPAPSHWKKLFQESSAS